MKRIILAVIVTLLLYPCDAQDQKSGLAEYVKQIQGLQLIVRHNETYIQLLKGFSIDKLPSLLKALKENGHEFAFYDELYPSPTDPGAYFSYSQTKVKDDVYWSMTLGNQSWSGGIYQVSNATILTQLTSLINKGKLTEIQITNVSFFGHYAVEAQNKNKEEDALIRKIHTASKK